MYGVALDYKVHAKLYTTKKKKCWCEFFVPFFVVIVIEDRHLFLQNKVAVKGYIGSHNSLLCQL